MSDNLSELLNGVDMEKLMEKAGPILAALKNEQAKPAEHGANDDTAYADDRRGEDPAEKRADGRGSLDMNTLANLAGPLMSMMNGKKGGGIDPSMLEKIAGVFADEKTNQNMHLLNALRPFLSGKRSEKMDSAVSIMRMTSVFRDNI